ncbi:hypothetical protein TEA_008019 [Camellia sinensis var. sinensis]|uniref:PPM-type phosphatase domain-containing protein n=1 Tax=Camellia sinensis var. sinensis TaxID=542762 RepID=A0A4S4DT74_CAMSN|nr:hypothetical protein TEA_008019 [Camellia sinensis var. sinensis]
MGHLSSMFNGLARSLLIKKGRNSGNCGGREAADAMARAAKKNELILRSSGIVNVDGSNNFASVFSRRGEKGANQDCSVVWEEFGCQEDMMFCGVFDGHGPWGHFVAKMVRETMPLTLLCNWQEMLAEASVDCEFDLESDKKLNSFNIWKHSYLKTCATVDVDLGQHRKIDSFYSGTTALTIVRQGDLLVVANVGDSRAVLATTSDDGSLVWDVVSNQEAVQIVSSTPDQAKSAKRLVEHAVHAWKRKRRGIATDDISAICLFFHSPPLSSQQTHLVTKPIQ